MNNETNQNNWLRMEVHIQIEQSEAANRPHPKVLKSRKYKRRHTQRRKKEFEMLVAENKYLKGIIKELISQSSQVHARDFGKNNHSVAHSACQNHHPSLYVQDHQHVVSDFGASTERLDGLGVNDLVSDEREGNTMAELLKILDDDVASSGDFPDF